LGEERELTKANKLGIARAFQDAVVLHLEKKLTLAFKWCKENDISCGHLVVSGGVASNAFIKKR
jgi:N6-L-threonylcarbamoyladenine synthase